MPGVSSAAGNTPEAIRRIITNKLEDQTPDPQVEVRRLAGDGATVSLIGAVGASGCLRHRTAHAHPFGNAEPRRRRGDRTRGGAGHRHPRRSNAARSGSRTSSAIPEFDIALRGGDKILVEQDTRAFTALGATGAQARVPFESQTLSAVEAIAQVGGLSSATADPTGVFIMRNEPAEIANIVLGRNDLQGAQRLVYVLDLTQPNGMFMARDFRGARRRHALRDRSALHPVEQGHLGHDRHAQRRWLGLNRRFDHFRSGSLNDSAKCAFARRVQDGPAGFLFQRRISAPAPDPAHSGTGRV